MSEYPYDEYYDDDYEQDYDEWYEDHYAGGDTYLCKAPNGQLYIESVVLFHDGGWDRIDSESEKSSLSSLTEKWQAIAREHGRKLKPGEHLSLTDLARDYDDDDEDDEAGPEDNQTMRLDQLPGLNYGTTGSADNLDEIPW